MGTCEQTGETQGKEPPTQSESIPTVEESNLTISGPPASRTVIENLKKMLVQRQCSRESDDTENKNSRSNSGSDAAFYSQFSTTSSDSDSSDDYMIFQEISNQAEPSSSGRRRHRRRRSYSSSSSSPSPVARNRRKVTRVNASLSSSIVADGESVEIKPGAPASSLETHSQQLGSALEEAHHHHHYHDKPTKQEHDSANSTSSHKDSSSEDDIPGSGSIQPGSQCIFSSATAVPEVTAAGSMSGSRKLKSRRDRDRKRKRSELNYATNRPTKLMKEMEETPNKVVVIASHNEADGITSSSGDILSITGGGNERNNTNSDPVENPGNGTVITEPAELIVTTPDQEFEDQ